MTNKEPQRDERQRDHSGTLEILKLHQHCGPEAEIGNCLFCAAKDAIEALSASNTTLGNAAMSFEHELKMAQAENAKLRDAMGHLLNAVKYNGLTDKFGDGCQIYEARVPDGFVIDAEAALKGDA